jgi:hypothetical protein
MQSVLRNIHAIFQAKMAAEAHGYCVLMVGVCSESPTA